MISIDELIALFSSAGPSSPKSLSGGGSQSFRKGSGRHFPEDFWLFARNCALVCLLCFLACMLVFLVKANRASCCTFIL
ncbi:hypothetical protein Hanom_Chr01g00080881 [Helianthus anomalus]